MIYEKEKRYIIPFGDVPTDRAEMPEISVEERRGNFTEVETGFPEETAVKEAKRCLSCRRCLGCALCWAECKPEAIDFDIPDQELALEVDDVVVTGGQDNLFHPFKADLGYGKYPDVIVDLQLERMLSPTGPTKGMLLSPLDGRIPESMAIIQGCPDDDEPQILSSLVFGVNAAVIALHGAQNLKVTIVSPICQPFKQKFLASAEKIPGLTIIAGSPVSIEKGDKAQPLHLTYSRNGEQSRQFFDLIVVLTKQKTSPELAALSKKLKQIQEKPA